MRHWCGRRMGGALLPLTIGFATLAAVGCGDGPTAPHLPAGTIVRFTTPPANVAVGQLVPTAVVELRDASNLPVEVEHANVVVRLAGAPPGARLGGDTIVQTHFGIARFKHLHVDGTAGTVSLLATVVGTGVSGSSRPFDVVAAPDVILLHNATSDTARLLVDGGGADGFYNDVEIRARPDQPIDVILDHAEESNEVVVFQKGRAPTLVPDVRWTSGVDTVSVRMRDPVHLAFAVWVVAGDFAAVSALTRKELARTQEIFDENSVGIILDPEIIDATSNPRARDFADYAYAGGQDMEDAIGHRANEVNAYLVERLTTPEGVPVGGVAPIGGGFIAVGDTGRAHVETLWVHELGHTFGLLHAVGFNGAPWTDQNVMAVGPVAPGTTYTDLTEGQIFRIHFDEGSSLHQVYGLHPVGLRRCGNQDRTPSCPWIALNLP